MTNIWDKYVSGIPCVRETSIEPFYYNIAKPSFNGTTTGNKRKKKMQQYVKQCPDACDVVKLFD